MTGTEKKYSRFLGNLYWESVTYYDREKNQYVDDRQLLMVSKLYRKYGGSGDYFYHIDILQSPAKYMHYENNSKSVRAKRFEDLINSNWYVLAT